MDHLVFSKVSSAPSGTRVSTTHTHVGWGTPLTPCLEASHHPGPNLPFGTPRLRVLVTRQDRCDLTGTSTKDEDPKICGTDTIDRSGSCPLSRKSSERDGGAGHSQRGPEETDTYLPPTHP